MPVSRDISLCAYDGPRAPSVGQGLPAPRISLVDCDFRVLRPSPAGARGARSRPQASGHVHRIDRLPRPHALPLGDHRQLRRRGPRRLRLPASTSSSTPTAASRSVTGRAASPSTSSRAPVSPASRSSSPSSTPAASSAAAPTPPRAACTASAPPSSTPSPSASTSRSTAAARRGRCRSTAASPATSPRATHPTPPSRRSRTAQELRVVGRAAKGVTGTRIRYWADRQIFTKDAAFNVEELEQRARQTAFLVPGLEIVIRDERSDEASETSYRFDGGISEFADFLAPDAGITDTWRLTGVEHLHRDGPGPPGQRRHGRHRGRARVRRRRRRALGHRLRDDHAFVREHHRDAQGRDAPAGLRGGTDEGAARAGRVRTPAG